MSTNPQAQVNLLRPQQAVELIGEKEDLERQLNDPFIRQKVQNPGEMRRRLQTLTRQVAETVPHPVTDGNERDGMARRELELRRELQGAMLSKEEMRKNPPGAVDHEVRFQREMKSKVLEWKNLRLRLAADTSKISTWDRDVANLERYRPEGVHRLRVDAQIPGKFSMSEVPEENFAAIFPDSPTSDTALKQVKRRVWTDEQKRAAGERMTKARLAKQHAAMTAQES